MALDPVVNFFRSTIATLPLNSGTTTMVLASGDGNKLPNPSVDGAFNLVVYNPSDPFVAPEIVRCTARTSDTLTILRGQEGTSDATKAAGIAWTVELVPTAKTIQDIDSKKVEKTGDTMTGTLTATKLIPSGNVTAGNGMYLPTTNTLAFSTNGAERVRIASGGEVLIGVTSNNSGALLAFSNQNKFTTLTPRIYHRGTDTFCTLVSATDSNTTRTHIVFEGSAAVVGSITTASSATAYNTTSDYRLKEDVRPINNAINRLNRLNPVNFAWKIDGFRTDGFIAHEAQEVVPESVTGKKNAIDKNGNPVYQVIDLSKIVPLLTAAVKEQQEIINNIKLRLDDANI